MKTYIPKILITQQPGTDKPGFENEDGELPLFIESDLTGLDTDEDPMEDHVETIFK